MTELFFITGNVNKFHEIQSFIPTLKQLDMDLPEIQSLDVKEIVRRKFEYAREYRDAQFIVEDTSLHLKCLHGLPGPFIKWFLQAIGDEGLFQIAKKLGNTKATARTIIGYSAGNGNILFLKELQRATYVLQKARTVLDGIGSFCLMEKPKHLPKWMMLKSNLSA